MIVYALMDPRKAESLRYVGQTKRTLVIRHRDHLTGGLKSPVGVWIRSLLEEGVIPGAITLEEGEWTTDELNERERAWVSRLIDDGHDLLNALPGGDMIHHPRVVYKCAECSVLSANGVFTRHHRATGHSGKVVVRDP